MTDQSAADRKAFEEHCRNERLCDPEHLEVGISGRYCTHNVQCWWLGWQAALAWERSRPQVTAEQMINQRLREIDDVLDINATDFAVHANRFEHDTTWLAKYYRGKLEQIVKVVLTAPAAERAERVTAGMIGDVLNAATDVCDVTIAEDFTVTLRVSSDKFEAIAKRLNSQLGAAEQAPAERPTK